MKKKLYLKNYFNRKTFKQKLSQYSKKQKTKINIINNIFNFINNDLNNYIIK